MNIEHVEVAWLRIKGTAKRMWAEVSPRSFKRPEVGDASKIVEVVREKADLRS